MTQEQESESVVFCIEDMTKDILLCFSSVHSVESAAECHTAKVCTSLV